MEKSTQLQALAIFKEDGSPLKPLERRLNEYVLII
jgi:hypothetical protein